MGRLLNARGRVLPMAAVPLEITAQVAGRRPRAGPTRLQTVRGQVAVATTKGTVRSIALEPADPPAPAETVEAVRAADWVILGPGSWFTSVMPHLMVPALRDALHDTAARRLLTLNLEHSGETDGHQRAPGRSRRWPTMRRGCGSTSCSPTPSAVDDVDALRAAAARLGAEVVLAQVAKRGAPGHHDTLRLAAAYRDIFG